MNDEMKTDVVWKYPLAVADEQNIVVPKGSNLLSLMEQNNVPTIYFLVNASAQVKETIAVSMRGTGHPVEREMSSASQYIGTVSTYSGQLIWHVWARYL